jgi:hypothetical protein
MAKTIQRSITFLGGLSSVGNITTQGVLSTQNGTSTNWNSTWNVVAANSGAWSAGGGGGGGSSDWTYIANKPTTLAGYGITDAAPSTLTTVVANNSATWADKAFSSITGKPTTLAGYGITDATSSDLTTFVSANSATWANKAFSTITGTPSTLAGYGITDAAPSTLVTFVESNSASWSAPLFAQITSTPTTLAGYGIVDAAPYSLYTLVHNSSADWSDKYWSSILNKPTTLAGYGITDANVYVDNNFIPKTGGTITGSLSVLGTLTYLDTTVSVASAMYVDTESTETALRVTQRGSGDAIRVEDSTNPDETPFIVKADGLVGIGTTAPSEKLTVNGNVSATGLVADSYKATSGSINAQSGSSYTLLSSDNGKIITMSNAAANTVVVPAGLGTGFSCTVVQIGAGQVTLSASGVTMNSYQGYTKIAGQHAGASLFSYSANVFNLNGSLA